MIKVAAPNMACQVIDWAMQVHGGAGVSDDTPLAACLRQCAHLRFADGPDEVHRNHAQDLLPQMQPLLGEAWAADQAPARCSSPPTATTSRPPHRPQGAGPSCMRRARPVASPARCLVRHAGRGLRPAPIEAAPTTWRDALHLGYHRPPQGLHAHPPQVMYNADGRLPVVRHPAGRGVRWPCCRCSTSPACKGHERPAATAPPWCCCRAGTATPRRSASQRYRVTAWTAIPTMVVDFLMNPRLADYDLSSSTAPERRRRGHARGHGAEAADMGITYIEGYGMSETIAPRTSTRPTAPEAVPGHPDLRRRRDGGRPGHAGKELPAGEVGEIIVHGPQVLQGYWNQPGGHEATPLSRSTASAFCAPATWPTWTRRLLLHGRPPQAHDQRLRLQGLAGRGRSADVPAPRDPGGLRDRRQGPRIAARPSRPWSCSRKLSAAQ
jgi:hypothetical protein